ncbi:acyl-CoA reductase-like NAD-dependent aldehyde dehydrogenase [Rhizobium mongolense]|uniref:Acyl-CoA reductase-like NAD-dependent aldehyde dehydrogenase n=2 Tax=Rhizobium mongolense TaxID=57676 RepID=A0ABR6IZ80_9HYPH|nr:acyl-CoA reductase-like NAD-dependent aldehyde dehydrogenase [Rhizobium mongolense]TVZ74949.1 acyl-CoA reductase-like NAD-dependent aldehyde dehydrogenase [Rhizobium mongolense USDA 1844]
MDLPLPQIDHTGVPHHYWGANPGETEREFSARRAAELDKMIETLGPDNVGAFIAEPVLGTGGITPPPEGYWEAIQAVLKKHDVLLVADEVITGFGRTGSMFGSLESRRDAFAETIVREAGKTIVQARMEVSRCVNTLKLSVEEAKRNAGEIVPFDAYTGSEQRQGWFTREPLGIITAITPYNDPLNLVAHKLGPAIAGGNAILLKPSNLTPFSAINLVEALLEAGLPHEVITIVHGDRELVTAMITAREVPWSRLPAATGEAISRAAGLKKLAMELGGNAPVIVMNDCDFNKAVEGCVSGAFWAAGQNCIGAQRILIQAELYDRFREAFVAATQKLKAGDPLQEDTDVGPMISKQVAERTEAAVTEAIKAGAKLLCGNHREGSLYHPTVLAGTPVTRRLWHEEVFAPVVMLAPFHTLDEAIEMANDPDYSLHAGIFTSDLNVALEAANRIEAGDDQRLLRLSFRRHALRRLQIRKHGPRKRALRL